MSKNSADLLNKFAIGLGIVLELSAVICLGFNIHEYKTVDTYIVLGLNFGGLWLILSGLFIYADRHDIDIEVSFSIPVHIVNKED